MGSTTNRCVPVSGVVLALLAAALFVPLVVAPPVGADTQITPAVTIRGLTADEQAAQDDLAAAFAPPWCETVGFAPGESAATGPNDGVAWTVTGQSGDPPGCGAQDNSTFAVDFAIPACLDPAGITSAAVRIVMLDQTVPAGPNLSVHPTRGTSVLTFSVGEAQDTAGDVVLDLFAPTPFPPLPTDGISATDMLDPEVSWVIGYDDEDGAAVWQFDSFGLVLTGDLSSCGAEPTTTTTAPPSSAPASSVAPELPRTGANSIGAGAAVAGGVLLVVGLAVAALARANTSNRRQYTPRGGPD